MAELTNRDIKAARWVAKNRGRLTEIAREARGKNGKPVTSQFVHMVLRGKRKSHDGGVESILKRMGAPVG